MKVDALIVGQGLAGSQIAWECLRRGLKVLVIDRDEETTSSKVAAGLVTPLAGVRFNLPEGLRERLLFAQKFYWDIEEKTGSRFYYHKRIARIFQNQQEVGAWKKRLENSSDSYEEFYAPLELDKGLFEAPLGGFEMKQGGWLDTECFLETIRQHLLERAAYAINDLKSEELEVLDHGIRWKNVEASFAVFCQGWRGAENHFFDWIPMRPALGDILTVSAPSLASESRIVNKGGWLLPLGKGKFRAGSSYNHHFTAAAPSPEGKEVVLQKLLGMTKQPTEILQHQAGIRPVIKRSQVIMGRHPSKPAICFFNGLGSKGVLNGPWHASRLLDHIVAGKELPAEADLRSNF